jgi:LysM repeat protein
LVRALRSSLALLGDPSEPLQVAVRELILLVIAAEVEVHPDYHWADVEPAIRTTLLERFGFDRRELGQHVFLSEVQSVVQGVRGVVAVDVNVLAGVSESKTTAQLAGLAAELKPPPAARIPVDLARFVRTQYTVGKDETLTAIAAAHGIHVADLLRLNPALTSRDLPSLAGKTLVVASGIRPAQLAMLSPSVPDTLVLTEVKR